MIAVTAAIALPQVAVFDLSAPELMVVRGGVTAILVAIIFRKRIVSPSWRILSFSVLFAVATLALYVGLKTEGWGPNPTMIILTLTPMVNILSCWVRGEEVSFRVYASLTALVLGVAIAVNPTDTTFVLTGFVASVIATLFAGFGMEVLAGKKGVDPYNKTFWLAVVTVGMGILSSPAIGHMPFATVSWSLQTAAILIGFGLVGGFLYYLANIVAFEDLRTEVASTIAMFETPLVIFVTWLRRGDTLTPLQLFGLTIACAATVALAFAEAWEKKAKLKETARAT